MVKSGYAKIIKILFSLSIKKKNPNFNKLCETFTQDFSNVFHYLAQL